MFKDPYNLEKLFENKELLTLAFTHRSYLNENLGFKVSNERLEFLGDAVLEFVVSHALYSIFQDKEEGYLTALRAKIVNTENLAVLARRLKIGDRVLLSKGEKASGGNNNSSILADTVEAIIGALYLDQGLNVVTDFISETLLSDLENKIETPLKDPKSRLQEAVQARKINDLKYIVASETGPDHAKKFVVEARVNGDVWGSGTGNSKSEAEQKAAENALEKKMSGKR